MQKAGINRAKNMTKTLIVFDTNAVYNKESDLYQSFRPLQDFSNFLFSKKNETEDSIWIYI